MFNCKIKNNHILYNYSDLESFGNVERWIKDYKDNRGNDAPCVLVANKIDLKLSTHISNIYLIIGFLDISARGES